MITTRKGQAPVPEELPGAFFVLEFSLVDNSFLLHVDDEDRSTYDLGDEISSLQVLFRTRTNAVNGSPLQPELIDRTIDIAKELGMAQYIPTKGVLVEDRVLSIVPREVKQGLKFDEDTEQKNWLHGVR